MRKQTLGLVGGVIVAIGVTDSHFCLRPALAATPSRADFVVADGAQAAESIPDYVSWRVFSLGLRIPAQRDALLGQFGLTEQEMSIITINANASLADLQTIESEVRAYVDQKYGTDRKPLASFKRAPHRDASVLPVRPIVLPPGVKSLRAELERSGYLARIEGKQRDGFARFERTLRSSLPPEAFDRIQAWVTGEFAHGVKVVDRGVKVDALDRSSAGGHWQPRKGGQ